MSTNARSAGKYRLVRPPLTLGSYARRYTLWNLVVWFVCLWWISGVGFYWMNSDGRVSREITFFSTVWIGFFVGFVGYCTGTLQPRRRLLVGRLEPAAREWAVIERARPRSLSKGFWAPALMRAVALGACLGGVQILLNTLGGGMDYSRRPFQFYTVILPALAAALLSGRTARASIIRFVSASERHPPLELSQGRYVFLHNVLPYVLFNSTAGILVVMSRFHASWAQGALVPARILAWHLAITALVIVLFVVGAARFKTRLDFLSPIRLTGKSPSTPRALWSVLWALLVPPVVFFLIRVGFLLSGREVAGFASILALKLAVCLVVTSSTGTWAVRSVLATMYSEDLGEHPYVKLHRYLRDAGHLTP